MALCSMQGQYASNTPWFQFPATGIVVSIPVLLILSVFQRYLVGDLILGAVKGKVAAAGGRGPDHAVVTSNICMPSCESSTSP